MVGFVMLAVYITVIVTQRGEFSWEALPWALLMVFAAIAAYASVQIEDRRIAQRVIIAARSCLHCSVRSASSPSGSDSCWPPPWP